MLPRTMIRALLALAAVVALPGCGAESSAPPPPTMEPAAETPPRIELTADERAVWRPLPTTRAGIPVLLYHGIGEPGDFGNPADAAYGVTAADFARQMALLRAGGYETITLRQFRAVHAGKPVELPPRPLLLTFDDALSSSFDGAEPVLRELGWTAAMFVDAGAVEAGAPGYATWQRVAAAHRSALWEVQLHSGRGHRNIVYDAAGTTGPFYAYRVAGRERIGAWWRRVRADLEWGEARLRAHVPGYRRMSFAPPYGNFGQLATNDHRIPARLGSWLRRRFGLVFVQEPARYARAGDAFVPRLQITRKTTGGDIHAWLERELPKVRSTRPASSRPARGRR